MHFHDRSETVQQRQDFILIENLKTFHETNL